MSSSTLTTIEIVSAVTGGLIMIKGAKMLHGLNSDLSWYNDYLSILIGGIGAVSLWNGIHCIAGRAGLPKTEFCGM